MFREQIGKTIKVYIDDMLIKSLQAANHIAHLEEAFGVLRKYRMMLNLSKCIFRISSRKFLEFLVTKQGIEANLDQIQALLTMSSPRNIYEVQQLIGRVAVLNKFVSKSADKCLPFFKILRKNETSSGMRNLKQHFNSSRSISARHHYLPFLPRAKSFVYLFVSPTVISVVLIREEDRVQKSAKDGDKSPSLADFMVKSTHETTPELEASPPKLETPKEQSSDKDLARWMLFIDGSSNQHGCGAGLVLQTPSSDQMEYAIRIGFKATNNEAKYEALLSGLRVATELGVDSLDVFSDSQLVVKTMSGKIRDFKIHQIPREENKKADALANLASAFDFISDRSIPLEFLASLSEWTSRSHQSDHLEESEGEVRKIEERIGRKAAEHTLGISHNESSPYERDAILHGLWDRISHTCENRDAEFQDLELQQRKQ
ncbi:hypothetical protein Acr_10g0009430 [Actinidia rufa]|uniref:Reverse transcriptase domain-containing protein n=1 Tax=Actinidia rufa TaxID=165716 RepID=A0A7J0FA42_9ERIC|nr:hypothetical protein Acr_10g0009430 [Actinidia rufa]